MRVTVLKSAKIKHGKMFSSPGISMSAVHGNKTSAEVCSGTEKRSE